MFSLEMFKSFRQYEENVNFLVNDDVKKAWIVFINEFCRHVSYEWNEYLKNIMSKETSTFFGNLTTSDEAFTEWTITCKFDEIKTEASEIDLIGMDNWQVKRKKRKRGPHDSRQKMNIYFSIYNRVLKHRQNRDSNRYWQSLFFEQYFSNKQNENDNNDDESYKDMGMNLYFSMMPGIDAEIDGFDDNGVVSYSV